MLPHESGAPPKKRKPRRKPEAAHPKPKPPALDPLWRSAGVFTTNLGAFPDTLQKAAADAGVKWVAVLLDADEHAEREKAALLQKRPELERAGLKVVGWAPAYEDPEASAARAEALVKQFDLAGWIVNGELWWEGASAGLSPRWLAAWKGAVPLALSCLSSTTNHWARQFTYKPWVDAGVAIMPQVYGNAEPGLTVANMEATLMLGGVPRELLAPTFGTYGHSIPWDDYATWHGPRSYYLGETLTPEDYATHVKGG